MTSALGGKGLGNVGNTCGLNALLQCITHTDQLREYFLQTAPDGTIVNNFKYSIVTELKRLIREFWVNNVSIVPTRFAKAFEESTSGRLEMGEQMDMSEVFLVLLDKFENEWKTTNNKHVQLPWPAPEKSASPLFLSMVSAATKSWVDFMGKVPVQWSHLMSGFQVGQVVCNTCHHIYHNFEPFSALSLDIPRVQAGTSLHLGQCFKKYFDHEVLDGDGGGGWKCDKCGGSKAEKLTRFWSAPKVLVVVLKRFKYKSNGRLEKIHVPIDIPEFFSFLPGTELSTGLHDTGVDKAYTIKAIGCHFGSLNGGHYTALAKHDGVWHHFDDLSVNKIEDANMALKNNMHAYMLFYERK